MRAGDRSRYEHVAVIGCGVIGTSWTALFLASGMRVTVCDPSPDTMERTRRGLRQIAPTLARIGLHVEALFDQGEDWLRFVAEVPVAVSDADVVQESAPERRDVKQELWATIEASAPPDAVLASSSSSIPASVISKRPRQPERLLIGHPFNPPHLIPLVEVVPSPVTSPDVIDRAVAFYRAVGKRPQVISREVPGFVANRLQLAMFREAVHLVTHGIVTEQEVDAVVTSSIGLRWAVAGPFQTFHLGGGPGGLPDFIAHLGPAVEALWGALGEPRLDAQTVEILARQARSFDGSVEELAARRDEAQIRVMRALGDVGA